ncbi:metallophosphoesterase family protein [Hyphomonas adhaerens]|uniref:Exonuclease SbcD n=1 Tax=Hyphomonas adhaerens TaxID=81029 RepID=A0A3B9GTE0_9PROT|nr:DNA repair exonuclease [Hyphomonas adhaerens]HAE25725.1 exonuclease SbcD [Hyphomonas adhaerens]
MSFEFIHSSDLHLGRRFSNIPQPPDGNIRGRLMEARHAAISRLAKVARERDAKHILLAGDTFDTATPSASVVQQALTAMADCTHVCWWIIPGNHDNLRDAEPLWEKVLRDAPQNVRLVTDNAPIELSAGVQLLPCPVAFRSSGRDPTAELASMPTSDGDLRIGLAHAGVVDFTDSGGHIPPDRDRSAGLDYLALGDWHGRIAVSPRTHYSGSPEQDRFKHGKRGVCLAVSIVAPGAEPKIDEIEIGEFLWAKAELPLLSETNVVEALEGILPESDRRNVLMRVKATGWSSLAQQAELRHASVRLGPDFGFMDLNFDDLGTTYDEADIDEIDKAGALRLAANRLKDDAESETLSTDERSVSAGALSRLYAYIKEAE